MNFLDDVGKQPWAHHFYAVLRRIERNSAGKPRIGESQTRSEEVVLLSQEPFSFFSGTDLTGVSRASDGTPRLSLRFLGMFGPNGPLPLQLSETAMIWSNRDQSFVRFAELLSTRFLQLFFRTWANARPLVQFERTDDDRFRAYVGSFMGTGSPVLKGDLETAPARRALDLRRNMQRLAYAGLAHGHVKSARRLEQMIRGIFSLDAQVSEWAGMWLVLQPGERTALGMQSAGLGRDTILGSRVYSISDRFRIRIRCRTLAEYESLMPDAELSKELESLVFFYCGYRFEFEFEPGLAKKLAPAMQLGKAGRLGLTAWMAGKPGQGGDDFLWDARFNPSGRRTSASAGRSHQS